MTAQEKQMITSLRNQGLGYKRIAAQTGISANTVKSFLKRTTTVDEQLTVVFSCLQCGASLQQLTGRKMKKFCSDTCRYKWWTSHPDQVKRETVLDITCPVCGKSFSAYGSRNRKYCSHDCYIRDRFGGGQ